MIVVTDIEKSKEFYKNILCEEIAQDLGTYVVFKGGFSMMSQTQWETATEKETSRIIYNGCNFELYFEEDEIETFIKNHSSLKVFTPLIETPWGQRCVRIFDPDNHIIEIAESMKAVVKRFLLQGLSAEEASKKSMMPLEFVKECERKA
jgi:catechol 2,3-dioxygenase-like lactoylglutathione lyase family enzyme